MKKRLLAMSLALALCLGLAVPAFAAGSDFVIKNGVLTHYNGSGGDVTIPNTVTEIAPLAFYNCPGSKNITSISLPNRLTTIGYGAFTDCEKLTTLTIPASVTEIGEFPVQSCFALTNIEVDPESSHFTSIDGVLYTKDLKYLLAYPPGRSGTLNIPDGVITITACSVTNCPLLTSVTISNSVTLIDNSAFDRCSSLTSITIPDSVTEIGPAAFSATGLTEITIPSSVTVLGNNPFSSSKLTSITVDPNNKVYTSIDGVLYSKDTKTLVAFPRGKAKTWTIPNHVTSVGKYAFCEPLFGDEHVLTSVTVPNSVTKLGEGAFYNCAAMTQIILPDSITSIGAYAFLRCDSLANIYYSGSKAGWEKINISSDNPIENVTIHYNNPTPTFTDVPSWCADAVSWAAANGIAQGTGNGKFSPGNNCTRAQILTFLWRAKGEPDSSAAQFSGVRDYGPALDWAYENGLIDRRETYSGHCTRAAAVWFIWVAQGMPPAAKASSFTDVDYTAPNAEAVNWAVENGIVEGYPDGTFRPDTVCNRGAIAAMLHRAYVPEARLNVK